MSPLPFIALLFGLIVVRATCTYQEAGRRPTVWRRRFWYFWSMIGYAVALMVMGTYLRAVLIDGWR
jgi:hypothetical protein